MRWIDFISKHKINGMEELIDLIKKDGISLEAAFKKLKKKYNIKQ